MHLTTSSLAADLAAFTTSSLAAAVPAASPSSSNNAGSVQGLAPLPTDLTAGIHHFALDASGQPNITRVGDLDHNNPPQHPSSRRDLKKRVNTWTGCEGYSFTSSQRGDVESAWASLLNWASSKGNAESDWIYGHYFALEDPGVFAYLCEWGSGNHATVSEINQAHSVVNYACASRPGIFQWNEWKKGIGAAATGQPWCNGVSPA